MVLHDLHLALRYADHAIALGGGRAHAGPAPTIADRRARCRSSSGTALVAVGTGTASTLIPA